ncbi:MAG: alpha/beta hydrolase family protein [Gemmataceae bacterium]
MFNRRQTLQVLGQLGIGVPSLQAAATQEAPAGMPADPRRDLPATQADVGTLLAEIDQRIGPANYAYSFLGDRFRDVADFTRTARAKLYELLRYRPTAVEPRAEVLDRVERDDHIRERVLFSTAPNVRVPAYVLIPRGLKEPVPGIVDLHSHGGMFLFGKEKVIDLGRNHPAMTTYHERNYDGRPTATALVRRGYVVITIDAMGFGERRILMDADRENGWDRSRYSVDQVQRLNQVCRSKESTLAKALAYAGLNWPGIVAWDDIRTIDYLASRPEVDSRRIGCLGISMGGYRTMNLVALDERIKAAVLVGFMSTVRPMLRRHVDTHSWVHYMPELHRWLDWPDVASLAMPRSLMVQQCSRDGLFPLEGMRESLEKIGAAYAKAGCKEKFVGRFYDAPHHFTRGMQDDAFDWLDRELGRAPRR